VTVGGGLVVEGDDVGGVEHAGGECKDNGGGARAVGVGCLLRG
jgi:hypothetical protein